MPDVNDSTTNELSQFWENVLEFGRRYRNRIESILFSPRAFFRDQIEKRDSWEPALFAAINLLIPNLLFALAFAPFTFGLSLFTIIPSLVYGAIILLLSIIILHGFIRMLGAKQSLQATYRCVCYASVANFIFLMPIPFFNLILFSIAFCLLLYFAFIEVHELPSNQTILVLFVMGSIIFVMGTMKTLLQFYLLFHAMIRILEWLPL